MTNTEQKESKLSPIPSNKPTRHTHGGNKTWRGKQAGEQSEGWWSNSTGPWEKSCQEVTQHKERGEDDAQRSERHTNGPIPPRSRHEDHDEELVL